MESLTVRPIRAEETGDVAAFISAGYDNDIFFKWAVANDEERLQIVTEYYKVYLNAKGCISHVAETPSKGGVGATVWLPHDVDISIYDDIDRVVGPYAPQFRAVADNSHYSEPPMGPFYQLVAVVTAKEARRMGVGAALLKYQLDHLDALGISTYLEASTPYTGKGIYGKFGYQPVGELMHFGENAVLYPLWRPANRKSTMEFGGYEWRVLEENQDSYFLLSEQVLEPGIYHDKFEGTKWEDSSIRKYLNGAFLETFKLEDRERLIENSTVPSTNPWYGAGSQTTTSDRAFLLSVEEVVKYLGNSGQLKCPVERFYISDHFNENRKAVLPEGTPARWFLRTQGSTADFVCVVTNEGKISISGDFVNRASTPLFKVGIRPAIRVKKGK